MRGHAGRGCLGYVALWAGCEAAAAVLFVTLDYFIAAREIGFAALALAALAVGTGLSFAGLVLVRVLRGRDL
jgi:hypothetical protein